MATCGDLKTAKLLTHCQDIYAAGNNWNQTWMLSDICIRFCFHNWCLMPTMTASQPNLTASDATLLQHLKLVVEIVMYFTDTPERPLCTGWPEYGPPGMWYLPGAGRWCLGSYDTSDVPHPLLVPVGFSGRPSSSLELVWCLRILHQGKTPKVQAPMQRKT